MQETMHTRFGKDFQLPEGVFSLDNELQVSYLQNYLQNLQEHEHVIVYGYSLNSYCAIGSLLELGFRPSRITLVFPHQNISCFGDPHVDSKVQLNLTYVVMFRWIKC